MPHHYLLRDLAPLSDEQWSRIDEIVNQTARRQLVGRRLLPIYGPLGAGVLSVQIRKVSPPQDAAISLFGQEETLVTVEDRDFIPIPLLYRDFVIHWRNIEQASQLGLPLDLSQVAAAAMAVARREDELIFHGHPDLGHMGILNAVGRTTSPLGDWGQMGGAFNAVVAAMTKLGSLGFFGPYGLVTSPGLFAAMNRVFNNTGVLEIDQIRNTARAGVFLSPVLPEPTAVVISVGAENLDLAVAQDMITAYLQVQNLNHYFRVFEAVTLRIKRPQAIATLG